MTKDAQSASVIIRLVKFRQSYPIVSASSTFNVFSLGWPNRKYALFANSKYSLQIHHDIHMQLTILILCYTAWTYTHQRKLQRLVNFSLNKC